MKKTIAVAGVAAAFLVLAPGAALASTSPSATPTPGAAAKPAAPRLTVTPGHGVPGAKVRITVGCEGEAYVTSRAVDAFATGEPKGSVRAYTGIVREVRAGEYVVNLRCHPRDGRPDTFVDVPFVVDRAAAGAPGTKQVTKVPAGAPQTGGTDGPSDGSGPLAAAAAMGALAVGGSGLVLARRARRR